jgi:type VI secretion system secreted protein Hcp
MADVFYVSIEGVKQGKFKGDARDKIQGLAFHYEVTSPRDAATGQASGQRQHSPVTMVKEWGPSSPQLFKAAVTNEVLKTVFFEFVQTNEIGEEYIAHTVKLTNASVASLKQDVKGMVGATGTQDSAAHPSSHDRLAHLQDLEEVAFTFQQIDIENVTGKTVATDDWRKDAGRTSKFAGSESAPAAGGAGVSVQEPYAGLSAGASTKLAAPGALISRIPGAG